jgi:hypothetical protein
MVFVIWAGQVREVGEQLRIFMKAVLRPQYHMEDNFDHSVGK